MDTTLSTLPQTTTQVVGKAFGKRAASYIIDTLALYVSNLVVSYTVGIVIGVVMYLNGRKIQITDQSSLQGLNILIGAILFVLYFGIFEWLYGATPGKLILGMRVVKENGDPCDFGAACVRAVLRYIDGFFFAIPAAISMKEPLNQRIGDKAAHTIVVDAKDAVIRQPRGWPSFIAAAAVYLALDSIFIFFSLLSIIR